MHGYLEEGPSSRFSSHPFVSPMTLITLTRREFVCLPANGQHPEGWDWVLLAWINFLGLPHAGRLQTPEIHFLTIQKANVHNQSAGRATPPSKAGGTDPSLTLPSSGGLRRFFV